MVEADPRDVALRASCPVASVPKYGSLAPLEGGQRMLLASNGLFMQLVNPWLDCTLLAGTLDNGLVLPFGEQTERISFAFGVLPLRLLHEFIERGRAGLPNEVAGALIFDCDTGALTLRMHEVIESSNAHIRYRVAPLGSNELLAVDLHTHGRLPAFWSSQDDLDDQGIRICGVFGNLDRSEPSGRFRLVANGVRRGLPCPWEDGEQEG